MCLGTELVTTIFKLNAVEQKSITEECIDQFCVRQDALLPGHGSLFCFDIVY